MTNEEGTLTPGDVAEGDDDGRVAQSSNVSQDSTAVPPAVNPAGLPRREPFALAHTPAPPLSGLATAVEPTVHTLSSPWDTEPAAATLGARGHLEVWRSRAELLETEALAAGSPLAQAQGFVAASECWAFLGETTRAHHLIQRAQEAAPTLELAQLQARQLAAKSGNWPTVLHGLEQQARTGATPAVRLHALHQAAEICRLKLDKTEHAKRHLQAAADMGPEDIRASALALADGLGRGASAPRAVLAPQKWAPLLEPVRLELKALREPQSAVEDSASLPLLFRSAQQALREGRSDRAARIIAEMVSVPELKAPSLWLAACLSAASRDTRDLAVACLTELLAAERSADARNALLARALEQGSTDALRAALEAACDGPAVSALDQVALQALTGDPASALHLAALAESGQPHALVGAVHAALDPSADLTLRDENSVAIFSLARRAGNGARPADLHKVLESFGGNVDLPASLGPLLAVEAATAAGSPSALAAALQQATGLLEDASPALRLLTAVLHEMAGENQSAATAFEAALAEPTLLPAAADALIRLGSPDAALHALALLSQAAPSPVYASLTRVQAATLAAQTRAPEAPALLDAAAEASQGLPFAAILGEGLSQARVHPAPVASWLSQLSEQAEPSLEKPLLLLREAAHAANADLRAASTVLEEAVTAASTDLSSRLLHESLVDSQATERATWREELGSTISDVELQRVLYAEAALQYEQGGEHEDAQRAAQLLAELPEAKTTREAALYSSLIKRHEVAPTVGRASRAPVPMPPSLPPDMDSVQWLATAQRLERDAIDAGDLKPLVEISELLALRLSAADSVVPAFFSTLTSFSAQASFSAPASSTPAVPSAEHGGLDARAALPWLRRLVTLESPPPWSVRAALELAREHGDHETALRAATLLLADDLGSADKAALAVQAAHAAAGLQQIPLAVEYLQQALRNSPQHLGALELLARLLDESADYRAAASTLLDIATASRQPAKKLGALLSAATLFEGRLGDAEGARRALERAVEIDVQHQPAFDRLIHLYQEAPAPLELVNLYQTRINAETDPQAKEHWELERERALSSSHHKDAMQSKLDARLKAAPDDPRALEGAASLALARGDTAAAEQMWIRLAKLTPGQPFQVKAYERLAHLYENVLKNPERAIACYRELAEAAPADVSRWSRLVQACLRGDQIVDALRAQTNLVNSCVEIADKQRQVLALADMYETRANDLGRAQATLVKARKAWPGSAEILEALYRLFVRSEATTDAAALLVTTRQEVLRAIVSGPFDASALDILGRVARLRGERDTEHVYQEASDALRGVPAKGAAPAPLGERALDTDVKDQISPPIYSPSLRQLLSLIAPALDALFPYPAPSVVRGVEDAAVHVRAASVARAFGASHVEVGVSPTLPEPCVVFGSVPLRILFTPLAVAASPEVRDYLLVRACVLSSLSAIADGRLNDARSQTTLAQVLAHYGAVIDASTVATPGTGVPQEFADRLPPATEEITLLAQESASGLHGQVHKARQQFQHFANRSALVWVGSFAAALEAEALASPSPPLPSGGEERRRWLGGNAVIIDLFRFLAMDTYTKLRSRE